MREGGKEGGREGGREEGRKGGRKEGSKEGREEGRKEGRKDRRKEGRKGGREEGRERERKGGREGGREGGKRDGGRERNAALPITQAPSPVERELSLVCLTPALLPPSPSVASCGAALTSAGLLEDCAKSERVTLFFFPPSDADLSPVELVPVHP